MFTDRITHARKAGRLKRERKHLKTAEIGGRNHVKASNENPCKAGQGNFYAVGYSCKTQGCGICMIFD